MPSDRFKGVQFGARYPRLRLADDGGEWNVVAGKPEKVDLGQIWPCRQIPHVDPCLLAESNLKPEAFVLPQAKSAEKSILVVAGAAAIGQLLQLFDVAAANDDFMRQKCRL